VSDLKLILDADGAPVLHAGDVISLRPGGGNSWPWGVHSIKDDEPLIVEEVTDKHIKFRRPFGHSDWVFKHDVEVKLLARGEGDGGD
jgi:hypothetical protein